MNQLIPLTTAPNQKFMVPLNIDGGVMDIYFDPLRYNEIAKYWVATLKDSTGNIVLDSVPFITGINLLQQFAYLGIGSAVIVNASNVKAPDFPNSLNLGTDFYLLWGDTP